MNDSFSLDENANHSFDDVPQSTPKKQKCEYICSVCDKVYTSKYHFNNHVQSHSLNDSMDVDVTTPSIHLDVSDVSFSLLRNKDCHAKKTTNKNTFKKPKTPAPKKKAKFVCGYCRKGYICSKSFQSHLRNHKIQDAASKFPDMDLILKHSSDICLSVLSKVEGAPSSGDAGKQFGSVVAHIKTMTSSPEWETFCKSVCEELLSGVLVKKFLLPSALLTGLVEKAEVILSSVTTCDYLIAMLVLPDTFPSIVLSQFFLEFVLKLVMQVLIFIGESVRGPAVNKKSVMIDSEDKEVIFYVGGSIMRGYLRIASRYKSSHLWSAIAQSIKTNILCEEPSSGEDSCWTKQVNRGGLLFIKPDCQLFFVHLAEIVFAHEQRDGSIDFDRVIKAVTNSHISVLWDCVILDSLSESTSLTFMNDVVQCFCNTCGRGFAKRRLNALRDRPEISMSIRHKVASRKGSKFDKKT